MIGIGVLVGLAIGLTGIGSGSLLILFGRMSPVTAVGTSISFSFLTKVYGSWKFYARGLVKMDIVRDLGLGCMPGALLGAFVFAISTSCAARRSLTLSCGTPSAWP
jgi:uncharacterized membrane protein YfcA